MLTMIDRHAVQALLQAGVPLQQIATQYGVSPRTVQRIGKEAPITDLSRAAARQAHAVGRPAVSDEIREQLQALVSADPLAPPLEHLRLLRAGGVRVGESTFYRLYRELRATLPVELMVRFEGVAGEFAQFDFGEVDLPLLDGRTHHLHFAAYRLKYSRWMWLEPVPDQRVESLVRSLLAGFAQAGGVPLQVVFDRPKTVVVGYTRDGHRPIWHPSLGQLAIDYGFAIELCAPHSPQQKGAVENLVGFAKRSFFRARRFADARDDLGQQLRQWLTYVNEERPNRATRVTPLVRLAEEHVRMKRLPIPPDDYALTFPVHVGPTAMVEFQGYRYAMPAPACGLPATLYLRPHTVRIVTAGGRYGVDHPRIPAVGTISYIPGQRAAQLAAVAGQRKRLYFMRQRLLELGPVAVHFLTELIHGRPHTWRGDVERLFGLLEQMGDPAFLQLLERADDEALYGADHLIRLAARPVQP
jgi:transposase